MTYNDLQNFCNIIQSISSHMSRPVFQGLIYAMIRCWCDENHENEMNLILDLMNGMKTIE